MEELPDDEIDCEFRQQVEKFCSHIWETSPPKTIPCGRTITGTRECCCAEGWMASTSWLCLWGRIKCPAKWWRWGKGEVFCWLLSLPVDLEPLDAVDGVGKS